MTVNPKSAGQWAAVLPTYVGLLIIVASAIFWAVTYILDGTGAISPALLAAAGTLITAGLGTDVVVTLKRTVAEEERRPLPPAEPESAERSEEQV